MNAKNRRRYFYAQRDPRQNKKKKKNMSLHHIDTIPRVELIDTSINRSVLCSNPAVSSSRKREREREIRDNRERNERDYIIYTGLTSWQLRTWRRVIGAGCGTWRDWTGRRHSRNFCFAVSINDRFNKPAYRSTILLSPRYGSK